MLLASTPFGIAADSTHMQILKWWALQKMLPLAFECRGRTLCGASPQKAQEPRKEQELSPELQRIGAPLAMVAQGSAGSHRDDSMTVGHQNPDGCNMTELPGATHPQERDSPQQPGTLCITIIIQMHGYMHVPQPCQYARGTCGKRERTCAGKLRAHGVAGGAVVAQQRERCPQRHCAAQLRVAWLQHPARRPHNAASRNQGSFYLPGNECPSLPRGCCYQGG